MKSKQFDSLARELFSETLSDYGFICERSRHCAFHRQCSEIWHFIIPDMGTRGEWFDVKVFPSSPLLDPLFTERFPDNLGIPSDWFSYLSERGVGPDQETYACRTEEHLRTHFERRVRAALIDSAIPYLDQFHTMEDVVPVLKHPLYLGVGLHRVGRIGESVPLLKREAERLATLNTRDRVVSTWLRLIEELLQRSH